MRRGAGNWGRRSGAGEPLQSFRFSHAFPRFLPNSLKSSNNTSDNSQLPFERFNGEQVNTAQRSLSVLYVINRLNEGNNRGRRARSFPTEIPSKLNRSAGKQWPVYSGAPPNKSRQTIDKLMLARRKRRAWAAHLSPSSSSSSG